jgi:hypothetical protein
MKVSGLECMYSEERSALQEEQEDSGLVWFVTQDSLAKILVAYCILVYAWFAAKILAANRYPSISLTDSCQIFGQVWAKDFLTKILAANSYQRLLGQNKAQTKHALNQNT